MLVAVDMLRLHPEFTEELARQVCLPGGADRAIRALRREYFPVEGEPISECEFVVPVGYDMPSDRTALEAVFSKGGISEVFCNRHPWEFHPSCAGINQTPGDRIMRIECLKRCVSFGEGWDGFIADMDRQGYRPAIHHEGFAVTKNRPDIQRRTPLFILGSSCQGMFGKEIMWLTTEAGELVLMSRSFDDNLGPGAHFLFVRKTA
jgi:hypothetical protein